MRKLVALTKATPDGLKDRQRLLTGQRAGKGENFPLLGMTAERARDVRRERPVLLDPCNANDCALLAFRPDGECVVNPLFRDDAEAAKRVKESIVLLNLNQAGIK